MAMMSVPRSMGRGAVLVLAWALGMVSVVAVLVAVVVPRLVGGTPYVIETGSMRPIMPPGTLVVDRPAKAGHVGVGTVITYQLRSGDPVVVTHRVIAVVYDGSGHRSYRTQGDANDVADQVLVDPVQIRGVRWYSLPLVGRFGDLLTRSQHVSLGHAAAGALVLYAGVVVAAGKRKHGARHATKGTSDVTAAA